MPNWPDVRIEGATNIQVQCATTQDLSDGHWGLEFFALLSSRGLVPDALGTHEPIRHPYSSDEVLRLWETKSVLARGRAPRRFLATASWTPKSARGSKTNFVSLSVERKLAATIDWLALAWDLLVWSRGLWASVSTVNAFWKQYNPSRASVPGVLPGVFWANLFGPAYDDLINWESVRPSEAEVRCHDGIWTIAFARGINDPVFEDPSSGLVAETKAMIGSRLFRDHDAPEFPPQILTGQPTW